MRGRHPHKFARAGGQAVAAALKAAKAKTPPAAKQRPVQLPADTYGGDRRAGERERRASGYTSLRVSKRTRELLEQLATQARNANSSSARRLGHYSSYYSLGVDELLYWDALERLAQKPLPTEGR